MTYIWQSQAPVSINMCLTIKCLLKEYKAEEVPYSLFFRTVTINRGNSCELKPKKKLLSSNWSRKKTFLSSVNGQIYFSFRSFETWNELPSFCLGSAPKWSLPMNDRMHGMAYTWQNQGPVSINSC